MRTFVRIFRTRVQEAGAPHDDETVWGLLRRFEILGYDFTAPGSANESGARDRAALALHLVNDPLVAVRGVSRRRGQRARLPSDP